MSDEELIEDDIPENDAPEADVPDEIEPEVEAPEAPQPEQTVWSAFRSLPEFQNVQDDRAIAQRLYMALEREKQASHALQQYQQIMPVAQEYLKNRPEFEKWRLAQNAPAPQAPVPAPAAAEAPKKWWNPPELRDAYKKYIVKDEQGRDTIHPDTPLDARHAITEFFDYKSKFANDFLSNPEQTLAPVIERFAREQAQQIVKSQLEEAGRNQYVQTLEEQNKGWLYSDPAKKIVSPEGAACQKYIEQAAAYGIDSPEARWNYALQMVERDLLIQVQQAQGSQAQRQAFQQSLEAVAPPQPARQSQAEANMEYLRRAASRTANRAQPAPADTAPKGRTFEEQLLSTLETERLI